MMSTRDEEEERAEAWLREQGYTAKRPVWLPKGKGKRAPDFWAETSAIEPPGIWVEVKSTDKDGGTAALDEHYDLISNARIPPGLRGHATFHLSAQTARQSVKRLLKCFSIEAPLYAGRKCALAFVQQVRDKVDLRRAAIEAAVREIVWVFGSTGAPLHPPLGIVRDSFAQTTVTESTGEQRTGPAFKFFEWTGKSECSLVVRLDPDDRPLEHILSMSGGAIRLREKTVAALEGANQQIKAACVHRVAPGLVILIPRDHHAEPLMVQAACYGQLAVPFQLKQGGEIESGDMYHGRDGVFRPDKNRHVSAVVLIEASSASTYFPNPWAHERIEETAPIFRGVSRARID